MNYKDKEIEMRYIVRKKSKLLKWLMQNSHKKSSSHQVDEYFTPAHRDFLKPKNPNEWLRIRNQDDTFSVTYKNLHNVSAKRGNPLR